MSFIAALYTHGRCVTGRNHGEAFGKLSHQEQEEEVKSGFLDPDTGRFFEDTQTPGFYLKRLVLIRHGDYANDGSDPPMNEEGEHCLWDVAHHLEGLDFKGYIAFTSPLRRCRQSAAILSAVTHLHFAVNEDIREWDDGESLTHFRHRIAHVLDRLPAKSLLLTHCDFILHAAYLATGESLHFENRQVPTGSFTLIHDDKVLCIGQGCEVLQSTEDML